MKREIKLVAYSFEHGDTSLPHLKDLVRDTEDPEKSKILSYLRVWCPMVSPGILYDEITPGKSIGCGNKFTDGTYWWNDAFINYVDRYNIPVPEEFRTHILNNFNSRMERHDLLLLVDSVEIKNNPVAGSQFNTRIYKNGAVKYRNGIDSSSSAVMFITPEDAQYIIDPVMTELFCYDSDNHGTAMLDGYHWKIVFYKNDKVISTVDGWPNEDLWRYYKAKAIIEFAERYIHNNIGSEYMNFYKGNNDD